MSKNAMQWGLVFRANPVDVELHRWLLSLVPNCWGKRAETLRRCVEIARLFDGDLNRAQDALVALSLANGEAEGKDE